MASLAPLGIHHEKGSLYLTHSVHVSVLGLIRTDRFYARVTDHSVLDEWSKKVPSKISKASFQPDNRPKT